MRCILLIMFLFVVMTGKAQEKPSFMSVDGVVTTYGLSNVKVGYGVRGSYNQSLISHLSVGLGSGFDKYIIYEGVVREYKTIPLFAQGRYVLHPESRSTLYGNMQLGYGLGFLNKDTRTDNEKIELSGGMLVSPEVGVLFLTKNSKIGWRIGLGYQYQSFQMYRYYNNSFWGWGNQTTTGTKSFDGYDNFENKTYHMRRLLLKVGVDF